MGIFVHGNEIMEGPWRLLEFGSDAPTANPVLSGMYPGDMQVSGIDIFFGQFLLFHDQILVPNQLFHRPNAHNLTQLD